jgi:hypothetical protein
VGDLPCWLPRQRDNQAILEGLSHSSARPEGGVVKTQQSVLVDVRGTWKPYLVMYEVINVLRDGRAGPISR